MDSVTNEEYEEALNNTDNRMIMNSACVKFAYSLTTDEIYRCKLMALWESLKKWSPDGGRKFTSFLYQRVYWECLKNIAYNKRYNNVQIDNFDKEGKKESKINELLDVFPGDLKDILEKRLVYKMTLREIGDTHNCCYETIRKKIKKAAQYIKNGV